MLRQLKQYAAPSGRERTTSRSRNTQINCAHDLLRYPIRRLFVESHHPASMLLYLRIACACGETMEWVVQVVPGRTFTLRKIIGKAMRQAACWLRTRTKVEKKRHKKLLNDLRCGRWRLADVRETDGGEAIPTVRTLPKKSILSAFVTSRIPSPHIWRSEIPRPMIHDHVACPRMLVFPVLQSFPCSSPQPQHSLVSKMHHRIQSQKHICPHTC